MSTIVERLRDYEDLYDGDIADAADMLEMFFGQMQIVSCHMDSQHHWRVRHGWPMNHAIGQSAEEAMRAVVAEVKRSRNEARQLAEQTRRRKDVQRTNHPQCNQPKHQPQRNRSLRSQRRSKR